MSRVKVACYCAWCNRQIEEGEDAFSFLGSLFHVDCFEENAVDLLKEQGAYETTAEYEEAEEYEY